MFIHVRALVKEMRDDSIMSSLPNGPARRWWSLVGGHGPLKQCL